MKKSTQNGFTLIEALMYITIAGAILTVIATFWGATLSTRAKNNAILEVELQGGQISNEFSRVTHSALGINSPTAPPAVCAFPCSPLNLKMTSTGTGACGTAGTTCFSLVGTTLNVQESSPTLVPLSSPKVVVSALSFQNLSGSSDPGTGTVQMTFTVRFNNQGGSANFDYQKTFTTSATIYKL